MGEVGSCLSYILVPNKLPQTLQLITTHIYYLTFLLEGSHGFAPPSCTGGLHKSMNTRRWESLGVIWKSACHRYLIILINLRSSEAERSKGDSPITII